MKILVCVKQVPDSNEVALDGNYSLIRSNTNQKINLADEGALELALILKEQTGGEISVICMGKKSAEGMLRETVSRGVDGIYLINDPSFAGADTLATAHTLFAAIQKTGPYDLILCGRRSSDGETGQVGPELASLLGIPVITNVTKVVLEDETILATRLLEEGNEKLTCSLPALITLCEWSYSLRLPSLNGLKRARTSSLNRLSLADLTLSREQTGLAGSPTRVTRVKSNFTWLRQPEIISDLERGVETVLQKVR